LSALAGAKLIYGMGMLELGITFSLTQLVIDNKIAKMVKKSGKKGLASMTKVWL